jgi:heat shock protein HslJ
MRRPNYCGRAKLQLLLVLTAAVAGVAGCSASAASGAAPAEPGGTMAQTRPNEAGGSSLVRTSDAIPKASAAPEPPSSRAVTDAGPNTALGKHWVFDRIEGYNREMPGPPKSAGFLMSRGNGRVVGSTSCNRLSANFKINPVRGTLHFSEIWFGRSMCGEPNISTQAAVLHVMHACDSFRMVGKRLALMSHGQIVAELVTS